MQRRTREPLAAKVIRDYRVADRLDTCKRISSAPVGQPLSEVEDRNLVGYSGGVHSAREFFTICLDVESAFAALLAVGGSKSQTQMKKGRAVKVSPLSRSGESIRPHRIGGSGQRLVGGLVVLPLLLPLPVLPVPAAEPSVASLFAPLFLFFFFFFFAGIVLASLLPCPLWAVCPVDPAWAEAPFCANVKGVRARARPKLRIVFFIGSPSGPFHSNPLTL
jgi:hypothetical protein